jgi:hypothetical protein
MQVAQSNREEKAAQIRKIKEEAETIRQYVDQYQKLQTSGVIGDEDRLELVEALGRIRSHHHLYALGFDIGKQVVIPLQESDPKTVASPLSLRSSRIQITLPLLHEEDLTRLLDQLREVGRGLFVVEECSISGSASSGKMVEKELLLKENLKALCKIQWLTLKSDASQREIPRGDKKPGGQRVEVEPASPFPGARI